MGNYLRYLNGNDSNWKRPTPLWRCAFVGNSVAQIWSQLQHQNRQKSCSGRHPNEQQNARQSIKGHQATRNISETSVNRSWTNQLGEWVNDCFSVAHERIWKEGLQVAVGSDADLEAGVSGGGGGWRRCDKPSEQDATPLNLADELPIGQVSQETYRGRWNGQSGHHQIGHCDVHHEHVTCIVSRIVNECQSGLKKKYSNNIWASMRLIIQLSSSTLLWLFMRTYWRLL